MDIQLDLSADAECEIAVDDSGYGLNDVRIGIGGLCLLLSSEQFEELHRQARIFWEGVDPAENPTVSDGFGSTWSTICPECRTPTVQVVRPGKAQCSECGK